MSKQETAPKAAPDAIRVESAHTVQGRAATTISVEVEEAKLGQQGANANHVDRAVAVVSRTHEGKQEWKEEELHAVGRHVTEDARVVKTFSVTLSEPIDAHEAGVAVKVETREGAVWANDKNAPVASHDANKEPTGPKP